MKNDKCNRHCVKEEDVTCYDGQLVGGFGSLTLPNHHWRGQGQGQIGGDNIRGYLIFVCQLLHPWFFL